MSGPQPFQRWVDTTRGQVMARLRDGDRRVSELASELGLTENAVRSHLTSLERDGLVEAGSLRREGVGKPAVIFRLTAMGEEAFPKGYAPVLVALISLMKERFGVEEATALLRDAGRAAAGNPRRLASWEDRVTLAQTTLATLGGDVELIVEDDTVRFQGKGCPLAQVVAACPEACQLVEQLLEELLGCPVQESCVRGERPRCSFIVRPGATSGL